MPALPPLPELVAPLPTPILPELGADLEDDDDEEDPMDIEGNDIDHEDRADEVEIG